MGGDINWEILGLGSCLGGKWELFRVSLIIAYSGILQMIVGGDLYDGNAKPFRDA